MKVLSLLSSHAELRIRVMVCRIIFSYNLLEAWTAFRYFVQLTSVLPINKIIQKINYFLFY